MDGKEHGIAVFFDKVGAVEGINGGVVNIDVALGKTLVIDVDVEVFGVSKWDVVGETLRLRCGYDWLMW